MCIHKEETFITYLWNNIGIISKYWIIDMGWDLIDLTCDIRNQILILLIFGLIKLMRVKYEQKKITKNIK